MVFNATFNNISAISWRSVLLLEELENSEKTPDLPQVTDKLYHICNTRYFSIPYKTCCVSACVVWIQVARYTSNLLTFVYYCICFHSSRATGKIIFMLIVLSIYYHYYYNVVLRRVHLSISRIRTHNFSSDKHWLHK